jgi:hypothetical protein
LACSFLHVQINGLTLELALRYQGSLIIILRLNRVGFGILILFLGGQAARQQIALSIRLSVNILVLDLPRIHVGGRFVGRRRQIQLRHPHRFSGNLQLRAVLIHGDARLAQRHQFVRRIELQQDVPFFYPIADVKRQFHHFANGSQKFS